MSGIAVISKAKANSTDKLKEMLHKIKHRGPDAEHYFSRHDFAAGYCHLATAADPWHGKLPDDVLVIADGRFFCGADRDRCLNPSTARQNLIDLYHTYGSNLFTKIDGEFVILISIGENLLLARDPFGLKPLYYGVDGDSYFFASEIKALTGVVEGIREFPPGCYWTPQTGFTRYFTLKQDVALGTADAEEIKQEIKQSLKAALKIRLPENEKTGVLLSGGLDSSIIAALAAEITPKLAAFSAGLPGSSDLTAARSVAQYLGMEYHEIILSEKQLLNHTPEVIYHLESFDLPLVSSALANFLVSKLAGEHGIKLVCVGEGADELFGGYHYLKEFSKEQANAEMLELIFSGRKGCFQRVDRMNTAHSLEPVIPFMDSKLLQLALTIPVDLKIRGTDRIEKWILREAFSDALPPQIVKRVKEKFYEGSGSGTAASTLYDKLVDVVEYEKFRADPQSCLIRSKEEYYYYKIYRQFYPVSSVAECIHQTKYI